MAKCAAPDEAICFSRNLFIRLRRRSAGSETSGTKQPVASAPGKWCNYYEYFGRYGTAGINEYEKEHVQSRFRRTVRVDKSTKEATDSRVQQRESTTQELLMYKVTREACKLASTESRNVQELIAASEAVLICNGR